jgi:hypothetical protein
MKFFSLRTQAAAWVGLAAIAGGLQAADITWVNSAGGFWNTAANWNPTQVPGPSDHAWITNSGTYTVTNNSQVILAGLTLGGESGNQALNLLRAVFALNGDGNGNANASLWIAGGTLGGSGMLTLAGPLNWTSGTITGAIQCAGGTLSTSSGLQLDGGHLVNAGVLTLSGGGTLWTGNGSVLSNLAGATCEVITNFNIYVTSGAASIWNGGLFRKSGSGTAYVESVLTNTGTLLVDGGTLDLRAPLRSLGGTIQSLAPGALIFGVGSGTHMLDANSLLTGDGLVTCYGGLVVENGACTFPGTIEITSGDMNFNSAATIGNVTIDGFQGSLSGTGAVTTSLLTITTNGVLGGSGSVTVNGPLNWSSGTITGTVYCAGGTLAAAGAKYLTGGRLINAGVLNVGGSLWASSGSVISNLASATFDLTTNLDVGQSFGSAAGAFYNAGVFRKSGGNGTAHIYQPFNNTGTMEVQSGAVSLHKGGTNSGSYSISAAAALSFEADTTYRTYTFDANSSITGEGTLACNNSLATVNVDGSCALTGTCNNSLATVNVDGSCALTGTNLVNWGTMNFNVPASVGALTVSNGTLGGSGLVVASGPLNWLGGTITGAVQCAAGAISSGTRKYLTGGLLINSGVLTLSGTNLATGSGSVISNLAGATFDITTNLDIGAYGTAGTFYNAGLLRKSGGTGVTVVYDTFHNSGSVLAQRGRLVLGSAGSNSGSNSATGSGILSFAGTNIHILDANSSLIGDGTVACGGTVVVNGTCVMTGTNVIGAGGTMSFNTPATLGSLVITGAAATLGGSGVVAVSGPLNWTAGTITGAVQCLGGTLGGGDKYLAGGQLVNAGMLTFSNGPLYTSSRSVISNLAGATWYVPVWNPMGGGLPANIFRTQSNDPCAFYNAGLLRSAGTTIADDFYNTGTVQCTNGTLSFWRACEQTAGLTRLDGGKLKATQGFALNGGVLAGTNTLTGNVTSSSTLSPGASPGVFTIASNYTQMPGGVLEIELGGPLPGTGFDQLVVTGAVALAGTLNVSLLNGFIPEPGSTYRFLTAGSLSGVFPVTNFPSGPSGMTLEYAADGVTLRVINLQPTSLTAAVADGRLQLTWPQDHTGWRLEAQTNAPASGLGTNWFDVPGSPLTNQLSVPINAANGSVFLRLIYP